MMETVANRSRDGSRERNWCKIHPAGFASTIVKIQNRPECVTCVTCVTASAVHSIFEPPAKGQAPQPVRCQHILTIPEPTRNRKPPRRSEPRHKRYTVIARHQEHVQRVEAQAIAVDYGNSGGGEAKIEACHDGPPGRV